MFLSLGTAALVASLLGAITKQKGLQTLGLVLSAAALVSQIARVEFPNERGLIL